MKKSLNWINDNWPMLLGCLGITSVVMLIGFFTYDAITGKTVIVRGEVLGHRYKPAWQEHNRIEKRVYDSTSKKYFTQVYYQDVFHPEQFRLTVLGPGGPSVYLVREATYFYYKDHDQIPIGRRIGGSSHTCLAAWIVEP